jgi:single-stranded-DNA-specific exonuclease
MNLVEALSYCQKELVRFGGHELAAGLSIQRGSINYFTTLMNQYAREHLSEDDLAVHLDADCELSVEHLTLSLAEQLTLLEPFGVANPVPQFILRDVTLTRIIPMGNGKHTKLIVSVQGTSVVAVYFGMPTARFPHHVNDRVDLLFRLNINEFQNERTLQLFVQDIHPSDSYLAEQQAQMDRYAEICAGASFDDEAENILPTRDDCALLYTVLRREYRQGHSAYTERSLLSLMQDCAPGRFPYIKLKFILRIFQELNICGILEPQPGYYVFDIYFTPNKTSIDKSSILKKLRGQCHKRTPAN